MPPSALHVFGPPDPADLSAFSVLCSESTEGAEVVYHTDAVQLSAFAWKCMQCGERTHEDEAN